jgi:secondary thiamine-phosphate synthase enzyme
MITIKVTTSERTEALDITREVTRAIEKEAKGVVHLFCTHTTCGLTINENADPDVMKDVMDGLSRLVPVDLSYRHREGNSDAHIKSLLTGHTLSIPVSHGQLILGTWQGIYLMEFDGPRERTIILANTA